jgi:lipopolysaccharide transport system permease protein
MSVFSSSPREIVASAWRHRALIATLTGREITGRYKGSVLGGVWAFLLPLLMLATYTFVFSIVFRARWQGQGNSRGEFALILFAGLLVFNLFSECLSRAPVLILQNQSYVKKVVFPLEILPWVTLGAALFHTAISYLVWQLFALLVFGVPHWTVLLFPLQLLPVCLITLGVSWFAAALGVYMRDLTQMIGVLLGVLMFLSPLFYPISSLPAGYQTLLTLNPLAPAIEATRDVLIWARVPEASSYLTQLVVALLVAWGGFGFFQRTRGGFADVV